MADQLPSGVLNDTGVDRGDNLRHAGRRKFLRVAGELGLCWSGGLLLGVALPVKAHAMQGDSAPGTPFVDPFSQPSPAREFAPNAFVRVAPDGTVTLVMPKVEMGQGVYTSISMLLAEELEIPLEHVRIEHAPADERYYSDPLLGGQITGGSTSTRYAWEPMRRAGAVARILLVRAAADTWRVSPTECYAIDGYVRHRDSARSLGYGALVRRAARLKISAQQIQDIELKKPAAFRLIGKPLKRLDSPEKVNGRAVFGIDIRLPGMLYAVSTTSPVIGSRVVHVDDSHTWRVPGVRRVVVLEHTVAVIGDHTWAARRGLDALVVEWDDGANASLSTELLEQDLARASRQQGAVARNEGNVAEAFRHAVTHLEAEYFQPFLAHAPMEPLNCTAHVHDGQCEIWTGTQVPQRAVDAAANVCGIPRERVVLHNQLLGGAFGRRGEVDVVIQAVQIAGQFNCPVKLTWMRDEDIRRDTVRPMYHDRISAGLDSGGNPVAWSHTIAGSSIVARFAPSWFKNGVDPDAVDVAASLVYDLPNQHIEYVRHEPRDVVTGFWRGVGATRGTFVVESFMDELAAAAGKDPLAYRRSLLQHTPRALNVLEIAARAANWGSALPAGYGRGLSVTQAFGSFLCAVLEVKIERGEVRVTRVVCAVDCGQVVNPDTVKAQIEGGSIFAITAALYGEITIRDGQVQQRNFTDYRILRIHEAPVIETHIVSSGEAPGGIGEPGCAVLAPALTNAIFAATGKRLRRLPVGGQLSEVLSA